MRLVCFLFLFALLGCNRNGSTQAEQNNSDTITPTTTKPSVDKPYKQAYCAKGVYSFAYSADKKYLVAGLENEIVYYNLDTAFYQTDTSDYCRGIYASIANNKIYGVAAVPGSSNVEVGATGSVYQIDLAQHVRWNGNAETTGGWDVPMSDVGAVVYSGDGKRIAVAGENQDESNQQRIAVVDAATKRVLHSWSTNESYLHALCFASDGARLLSGGQDGNINYWDATSGDKLRSVKAHNFGVNAMQLNEAGDQLYTAGNDGTVKVWNVESGELLKTYTWQGGHVKSVCASPDGKTVAAGVDKNVVLWNAADGKVQHVYKAKSDVNAITFTPDGAYVISGQALWDGEEKTIKMWKLYRI